MLRKYYKYICCVLLVFFILVQTGCNSEPNPVPEAQSDYTEKKIDRTIVSIKIGLPYVLQRVQEWRDTMHLIYINVGFVGKEQIMNRKGNISYYFYEENVTKRLDADASVDIDMNSNCISRFGSSYGTPKQLGGGGEELKTNNWNIDINETFDIIETEIGDSYLDHYDEPKVVLRCSESFWEFALYKNTEAPYQDFMIKIDPIKGEILEVKDNR